MPTIWHSKAIIIDIVSKDRFVAEIPIRWSSTDERIALGRLRNSQRIQNELLDRFLKRQRAFRSDPDFRRLVAESREAKREGRAKGTVAKKAPKSVPEAVTPRKFSFATVEERNAAWNELSQRHGLIREMPVSAMTDLGREIYEADKIWVSELNARQRSLGTLGIDGSTVQHVLVRKQRDRVLEYVGIKPRKSASGGRVETGRPRFASLRDPITSLTGSSSAKKIPGSAKKKPGALRVDFAANTFVWNSAGRTGKNFPIVARIRFPKNDPWLAKAVRLPIAQVRVLHRDLDGKRRWYVQLILVGTPPLSPMLRTALDARTQGALGIDVGSRHIAAVGPDSAIIADLAPTALQREFDRDSRDRTVREGDIVKRDKAYRRLQRRISLAKSRNPQNADAIKTREKTLSKTRDGKAVGKIVAMPAGFKKGARLVRSERDRALVRDLAEIARADAAARKNDHGRLVNVIATMGTRITLETVSYKGWQKAFGRQTKRFAPGAFEARIGSRSEMLGLEIVKVITRETKMSQLCHGCGEETKTPIRGPIVDRVKRACATCARPEVQRDLYSAFLARFASETSVDLQAAQAAWTGSFEFLCGARRMYDRVNDRRIPRPTRVTVEPPSLCAQVPHVQAIGTSIATANSKMLAPASVRDGASPKRGCSDSSGGGAEQLPRNRSNQMQRTSPPLNAPSMAVVEVRAGPSLEMRKAKPYSKKASR